MREPFFLCVRIQEIDYLEGFDLTRVYATKNKKKYTRNQDKCFGKFYYTTEESDGMEKNGGKKKKIFKSEFINSNNN